MFFETSPHNKNRNKNVKLITNDIPAPKKIELVFPYDIETNVTILDSECYPNYFMCGFKFIELNKYLFFELYKNIYSINGRIVSFDQWRDTFNFTLHRFLSIGFNSTYYDLPIIFEALKGNPVDDLKQYSNELIYDRKRAKTYHKLNHIDIIEVAPLHDGLKTYAGRIHAPRMQELPYEHDRILTEEEIYYVRNYNVNDLDNTELLYYALKGQIRLREKLGQRYQLDLRTKSDAQVAEAVIRAELNKVGIRAKPPTVQPGSTFYYSVPDFIRFKTPQLQQVLEVVRKTPFEINAKLKTNMPRAISALKIKIGKSSYKMGIGGLHSQEECAAYIATEKLKIVDTDVEGYYPNIILNQNLYPEHLGPGFLTVLQNLVDLRSDCKKKAKEYKQQNNIELYIYWDEESGSLKIATNGIFGKTGNEYSIVFSPQMMIQTTISGQLFILMMIEQITEAGFEVVSANTDGVVTLVPTERKAEFDSIVASWEKQTHFKTEQTFYKSIYSRDVNNYLAVKEYGNETSSFLDEQLGIKSKGAFCERGSALNSILSKNPETLICTDALLRFVKNKTPIEETIKACRDITRFVSVRKVEGGAQKNGKFLGKVIRWYYSSEEFETINYVKNGNIVPKSEGAKPLMDLPDEFPSDIDYAAYTKIANDMLFDIGYYKKPGTGKLL